MVLVEPSQEKVTTIASPLCGFVGLNPLMSIVPWSLSLPFIWSSTMPVVPGACVANRGASGAWRAGPTASVHAATSRSAARPALVVRLFICSYSCPLEECPPHIAAAQPGPTHRLRGPLLGKAQVRTGRGQSGPMLKGALAV